LMRAPFFGERSYARMTSRFALLASGDERQTATTTATTTTPTTTTPVYESGYPGKTLSV